VKGGFFERNIALSNFLGDTPVWYKQTLIACVILDIVLYLIAGPFITGWAILIQFIATLALALKCYPLLPGGLLALLAVPVLGLASPKAVVYEVEHNMPIIMLIIFLVPAVILMKELLIFMFTKVLLALRNLVAISVFFCVISAVLSAVLDALTVLAVVVTVMKGMLDTYDHFLSIAGQQYDTLSEEEARAFDEHKGDRQTFLSFIRGASMHAAVGTMLGGTQTLVGEPQNLLIGEMMGWDFVEFFLIMGPVTWPVFFVGVATCVAIAMAKVSDYGTKMPDNVRFILEREANRLSELRTSRDHGILVVQGIAAAILVVGLISHTYPPFLVGLGVLVFLTVFNGITEEHHIGEAIKESGSFAMVLAVFFVVVAVIAEQRLFAPITSWILQFEGTDRLLAYFGVAGVLSSGSDNVFVASMNMAEVKAMFDAGTITRHEYERIAIAINTGTNIPSIATPNGQAAFLYLLMSPLAPAIGLTYFRMMWLAFFYLITTTTAAVLAIMYLL
jgi:Na+:H+ antiporter, NhaB family